MTPSFILDFYAGPGGWSEGLRLLGLRETVGVEFEPMAVATARAAGHSRWQIDVRSPECRGYPWPPMRLYIASPPCFVAGTPVLTKRGSVPIEQVIVGDEVWTHENRWKPVIDTMSRQSETVQVGQITSTPDHPFYTRSQVRKWRTSPRGYEWSLGEPEWTSAIDIHGKFLATPLQINGLAAKWPCSPRLAGRYVADGWTGRDGIMIAVGDGREEPEGQWVKAQSGPSCRRFTRADHQLAAILEAEFGKGATRKKLPAWLLAADESERREFLDGYLAGDGHAIQNGRAAVTASEHLASMLYLLGTSLGYTMSITRVSPDAKKIIEGREVNQHPWWRISFKENDGRYKRDVGGHRWMKQRKGPEPRGVQTVYDITVADDHSFVAWGKVVHNCQSFSMAGKGEGRKHIAALVKALHLVAGGMTPEDAIAEVQDEELDERSVLVLEPMLVIRRHGPLNVAMEQVPPVLPIWEAYRDVLASWGYSAWTGMLHSEQFGVPQTRKRAVLIASRERQVTPPTPTHSRFHSRSPERLDDGVLPWVSMAQALNWGMTARPSMTVTGGGSATGGAEPFGNQARQTIKREEAEGRWALRGNQKPNGIDYQQRSIENPAQTITGETGSYAFVQRSNYSASGKPGQTAEERGRAERELEQPSVAITSKGFRWAPPDWAEDRPATTVQGDPRLAAPGHRCMTPACHPDGAPESMFAKATRVTVEEAGILQSFPADYPWKGNKGERFQQVGNAVPPLMAAAIVSAVLGLDPSVNPS